LHHSFEFQGTFLNINFFIVFSSTMLSSNSNSSPNDHVLSIDSLPPCRASVSLEQQHSDNYCCHIPLQQSLVSTTVSTAAISTVVFCLNSASMTSTSSNGSLVEPPAKRFKFEGGNDVEHLSTNITVEEGELVDGREMEVETATGTSSPTTTSSPDVKQQQQQLGNDSPQTKEDSQERRRRSAGESSSTKPSRDDERERRRDKERSRDDQERKKDDKREKDRERVSSREDDREGRDASREKDRHHRDKERDRERDKDKERERDRERERQREREKDRDRQRTRHDNER
jgi:hypothetical protein